MSERYAILLDGGFLFKKLQRHIHAYPDAALIEQAARDIAAHPKLNGRELLRVYYYDAPPAQRKIENPLDRHPLDLGSTSLAKHNQQLHSALEQLPDFALRKGETLVRGWKIGQAAFRRLAKEGGEIQARDLVPDISQKGVDLRIGLDIATLAFRRIVDTIVVVAGDSDLVPAFKLARREGLRVYLATYAHNVTSELTAHVDGLLDCGFPDSNP
jgi:uncharacterized LabA/DUF88 family protein